MSTATENGTATRTAAQWLEAFAEGWRAPVDADALCGHFEPLISDDMRLIQPQLPDLVKQAIERRGAQR